MALHMLESLGQRGCEACDGEEAVQRCRQPALVLMDVDMPRMEGQEATRILRKLQADGEVAPCPIVASASQEPGMLNAAGPPAWTRRCLSR